MVLPARIAYWAAREPDRPFLIEVGGRSATYGAFHRELLAWSQALRDAGVEPGDRIGSLLPPSVDAHLLWMAASCIGAVEVPIDPDLRGDFLDHVVADARLKWCVAPPGHAVPEGPTRISPNADAEPVPLDRYPHPQDPSCILYTSGTTGPAKGVIVPWGQIAATIGRIPREWLTANDAVYAPWPMFHVTGRSPLASMADVGGRVVLREHLSIREFWSDITVHGCTSTTIGAVAPLLLDAAAPQSHPLRWAFMAPRGDVSVAVQERFGVRVIGNYGSTEAGFPIVNRRMDRSTAHLAGWLRPGYAARVADDGELWVRPPAPEVMFAGYVGGPAAGEWYATGDVMRRHDDGSFEFVDRRRDTIRRFGENISATAVEAMVITEQDVVECAVVGMASAVTGQEVLLVVVGDVDPANLYERLVPRLPPHALPAVIGVRAHLPKTPTGKVRKQLVEMADDDWRAPN